MNEMRWIKIVLSAILAYALYWLIITFASSSEPDLSFQLRKMAKELNKQSPIRLNEYTRARSVVVYGNTIVYNHQLDFNKSDLEVPSVQSGGRSHFIKNLCSIKDTRHLLDSGADMKYMYYDINEVFITEFTISKRDCDVLDCHRKGSGRREWVRRCLKNYE